MSALTYVESSAGSVSGASVGAFGGGEADEARYNNRTQHGKSTGKKQKVKSEKVFEKFRWVWYGFVRV